MSTSSAWRILTSWTRAGATSASWALDHACPGPVTCDRCGGNWANTGTGAPYILTEDAAQKTAKWVRFGGQIALVWATNHVVYVKPEDLVRTPGLARLEPCHASAPRRTGCVASIATAPDTGSGTLASPAVTRRCGNTPTLIAPR